VSLDDLPTPALLLDAAALDRNISRMAAHARALGVALRPHVKTHKCVEIARRQRQAGAAGLTVSTLPEARACAAAGFDDLTWALPLAPPGIGPALDLVREGVTLRLVLDDEPTLSALEQAAVARGVRPHVWLKVDCGYHRAGVDPSSPAAWQLATRLGTSPAIRFDGLLTHAGHSYHAYGSEARAAVARAERDAVTRFAAGLRAAGVPVPSVSIGSTPSVTAATDLSGVDEIRPGNYALFDLTQVALGSCRLEDVAVSVLATVISHPAGAERAVVDAGALALSKDVGPPPEHAVLPGMGGVCAPAEGNSPSPDLRLETLSQEHGIIRPRVEGGLAGRLPVGSRVRILPNHACLVSACFDQFHVLRDGRVEASWPIARQR